MREEDHRADRAQTLGSPLDSPCRDNTVRALEGIRKELPGQIHLCDLLRIVAGERRDEVDLLLLGDTEGILLLAGNVLH